MSAKLITTPTFGTVNGQGRLGRQGRQGRRGRRGRHAVSCGPPRCNSVKIAGSLRFKEPKYTPHRKYYNYWQGRNRISSARNFARDGRPFIT